MIDFTQLNIIVYFVLNYALIIYLINLNSIGEKYSMTFSQFKNITFSRVGLICLEFNFLSSCFVTEQQHVRASASHYKQPWENWQHRLIVKWHEDDSEDEEGKVSKKNKKNIKRQQKTREKRRGGWEEG